MPTQTTYPKVSSVKPLAGKQLLVTFATGERKVYDCTPLLKEEVFRPLQNEELFSRARADKHGFGVVWNDEIDLAEGELWVNGRLSEEADQNHPSASIVSESSTTAYGSKQDLTLRVEEALKHTSDCIASSELAIWFLVTRERYSRAWGAFHPTLSIASASLFEGLILSLYKPLEPEGRNAEAEHVNVWRILGLAAQLQVLDAVTHTALKQKLRSVESIWSKVEVLRHNLVAHGKVGLSVKDELQSGPMSNEWRRLYGAYAEVLNAIAERIDVQKLDVEARRAHFGENAKRFFEALNS
jgi:hypothetical protein